MNLHHRTSCAVVDGEIENYTVHNLGAVSTGKLHRLTGVAHRGTRAIPCRWGGGVAFRNMHVGTQNFDHVNASSSADHLITPCTMVKYVLHGSSYLLVIGVAPLAFATLHGHSR
jgi:hypothetical protein